MVMVLLGDGADVGDRGDRLNQKVHSYLLTVPCVVTHRVVYQPKIGPVGLNDLKDARLRPPPPNVSRALAKA